MKNPTYYSVDFADNTDKMSDVSKFVESYMTSNLSDDNGDNVKIDDDKFREIIRDLIISNGMWWTSNCEKDIKSLMEHLGSKPYKKSPKAIAKSIVSFLKTKYYKNDADIDSPETDESKISKPAPITVTSDISADDIIILSDESLTKSDRVMKLYSKYGTSVLAKAMGVSSQRIRNIIKSKSVC